MWRKALVYCVGLAAFLFNPHRMHACRFVPSCSEYAARCLAQHGLKGCAWVLLRLWRCRPWGPMGFDPVPPPDAGKS